MKLKMRRMKMWKFLRQRWWWGFVFAVVKVSNPEPEIPAVFSLGDKQLSGRHTCTCTALLFSSVHTHWTAFPRCALLCLSSVCTTKLFCSVHWKTFLKCALENVSPVCTAKLFCSVHWKTFLKCALDSMTCRIVHSSIGFHPNALQKLHTSLR